MAPTIIWRPGSPNYTPGRPSNKAPLAIVDHIMAGTLVASDSWFMNPGAQVSAHFGVARTGVIFQWVKVSDSAWSNGILESPDLSVSWLAQAVAQGLWINGLTVSIEHEGNPGDIMPEAQYQSTLALHKLLCSSFGIPTTRIFIIGHYQIQKYQRANCPGPAFPWARLIRDLGGAPVVDNSEVLNGHTVRGEIRTYWQGHGALHDIGLPLTEEFLWTNPDTITPLTPQGIVTTVQVFERQVLEFNATEKDPAWRVRGLIIGPLWLAAHQIKG